MSAPVKSADRVLLIFELLTEHPDGLTLVEVQQKMGLPKSSTHGLLHTMVSRGFLDLEQSTKRFRIGIRLWQAGRSYLSAASIEKLALPYMEAVRDRLNETVQLAVLDGADNVYVAKIDPDHQLRLASHVGARLPAYATGIGKALLSTLDDDEVLRRVGDEPFTRYTATTLPGPEALIAELHEVRRTGYAEDHAEYTPGVFCVAVPLARAADRQPAMSVSIPDVRKTDELIAQAIEALQGAAASIADRIP
ncbi:IclR family transcriptional regulator [Nocardioides humi]|uniref:IclR family transcriptional regulator n=1 Tax=Nocardioides humi TaxID=449461 RepID=A0ABN2A9X9_9ACTN|nr:IclR family transcriptional regulator [Nocardioides humi]